MKPSVLDLKVKPVGTARTNDGRPVVIVVLPTGAIVPIIQRAAESAK